MTTLNRLKLSSGTVSKESCTVFNTTAFQEKIQSLSGPFVNRFHRINRSFVLFQTVFILALAFEIIFLGLFFTRFAHSNIMAFHLGAIFLTLFTYLVLTFYLQGRRPEKLLMLRDAYIEATQSAIPFEPDTMEYHSCINEAIVHFISELKISKVKSRFLAPFETLTFLTEKFRIWTTWKDLLKLKEMLLLSSIQQQIHLIKSDPSDLEAHASLASNYVTLASLYQDPRKLLLIEPLSWIPPEYESAKMGKKFSLALERALEEYHIIHAYAPTDPWVHAQRASLYKELQQPENEQAEYEKILEIDPNNTTILFRLGKLYFKKGEIAKGLKIYDRLQDMDGDKAQDLIHNYDAYSVEHFSFTDE